MKIPICLILGGDPWPLSLERKLNVSSKTVTQLTGNLSSSVSWLPERKLNVSISHLAIPLLQDIKYVVCLESRGGFRILNWWRLNIHLIQHHSSSLDIYSFRPN